MTALSVNVNKIAVLRNSRGGDEPGCGPRRARLPGCRRARHHRPSAPGRAPHPRRRCVRAVRADARARRRIQPGRQSFRAAARRAIPVSSRCANRRGRRRRRWCPTTMRSSRRTTASISPAMRARCVRGSQELKALGCRVSLFVDAHAGGRGRAAELGADRIELYTGPYAEAHAAGNASAASRCAPRRRGARRPRVWASMPGTI